MVNAAPRLALVLPDGDDPASVRQLQRGYFKALLRRLANLQDGALHAALRRPLAEALERLKTALVRQPDRAQQILSAPSLAALVNCAERQAADANALAPLVAELLPLLAFELASAGLLQGNYHWPGRPRALWSVSRNMKLDLGAAVTQVVFASGRVELRTAGGKQLELDLADPGLAALDHPLARGSAPFLPLGGSHALSLFDNNPLHMLEAHPDKHGNALSLGDHPAQEWLGALETSLALIAQHLPGLRAEMRLLLAQIVPVGYDPEKHLSASYLEDVGTLYMTLHPQLMTMVEATIHEFQHNKLYLLMNQEPVLENGWTELARSPVRPDPRPLMGILLAVHAFIPVAELYRRLMEAGHELARSPTFLARFGEIVAKNDEGTRVLVERARPTPLGQELLDDLAARNAAFMALPLPRPAAHVEHV